MRCIRWCHAEEKFVDSLLDSLSDHTARSLYEEPILHGELQDDRRRSAAYLVLYPGDLAAIGGLRSAFLPGTANDHRDPTQLVSIANKLFHSAFEQGIELIQAISPLVPTRLSDDLNQSLLSSEPERDLLLKAIGMTPVATLVEMACDDMRLFPTPALSELEHSRVNEFSFSPHSSIAKSDWQQLVESTYVATLDVPELNGKRRIENTLKGYATNASGEPTTWWLLRHAGRSIGCLLVTTTGYKSCELTYFGLIPEWRGRGLSKLMMNFLRDWASANNRTHVTLAVDLRNAPAIRLYQNFGFMTDRFVQAWICEAKK